MRDVRIIAGRLRGRKLGPTPPGVRPTSDRVREALFGRLGDVRGWRVLDLYCGTGALGIEALSRGAESLVAVDRSLRSIAATERNLASLGLGDDARTLKMDARGALRRLGREGARFDLILADPPYAEQAELAPLLESVADAGVLDAHGVVVVECAKRHALAPVGGLAVEDTRSYGDTSIIWLVAAHRDEHDGGAHR